MIKKIINEIKVEYRKNKLTTIFMGAVVVLAILNYLKPSSTSGILSYISISIVNFTILAIFLLAGWWFWWRKQNWRIIK